MLLFKDRFASMPRENQEQGIPPPFLYGTHYSTPGYVLHYLFRVAPEHMLCLQNGKFDAPDRMFVSLEEMWHSCTHDITDVKELIPEFFYPNAHSFLTNHNNLSLGRRHNGDLVGDVQLPRWASSPEEFINIQREALESEHVSRNLHKWIDLIFGYKQRGQEAIESDNLFYHVTYEGAIDTDSIKNQRYIGYYLSYFFVKIKKMSYLSSQYEACIRRSNSGIRYAL